MRCFEMVLDDLDWDFPDVLPHREDFTHNRWRFYTTADELEKRIKKNPLTRENVLYFVDLDLFISKQFIEKELKK